MHLIEILIPANMSKKEYGVIRKRLTAKFGGLTAFSRAPAEGLWKKRSRVQRNEIIVVEVMAAKIERSWWKDLRLTLEETLGEEEIVIRYHSVTRL